MPLPDKPDCADSCAHALLEAKRANPGGLRREDIALVVRPIIAAHVDQVVAGLLTPAQRKAATATRTIIPPEPAWVTAYSAEINYPMDGAKWCDNYAAKGWIVSGKAKMKDWQATCRNWKSNGWGAESRIYLGPAKPRAVDLAYAGEPKGDWRSTAKRILEQDLPAHWKTWADVSITYRRQIAAAHTP